MGVDIFTMLVVGSVGVALAGLTWRLMGDPGTRFGATPVAARRSAPIDIGPLIALAPFGAAPAAAGGTAVATDQALTLRGILLADPRAASSALISLGDAAPIAFYVGQAVGTSTIESIEIDHIVLVNGGARSILGFPSAARSGAPDDAGAEAQVAAGQNAAAAPAAPAPALAPPAPDAAGVLRNLGATPSGTGLAVGKPSEPMRMAGLQPGDQIVAINGAPASDVMRNPALLDAAIANGSARVDVIREGQRVILSVPVR